MPIAFSRDRLVAVAEGSIRAVPTSGNSGMFWISKVAHRLFLWLRPGAAARVLLCIQKDTSLETTGDFAAGSPSRLPPSLADVAHHACSRFSPPLKYVWSHEEHRRELPLPLRLAQLFAAFSIDLLFLPVDLT